MKRTCVVAAVLAALLCLALPAWSQDAGQEGGQEGPVTLILWTHLPPGAESTLLDAQIEAFNTSQEAIVVQRVQVEGPYLEALEQALATGDGPDIIDVPVAHVANYAWRGLIAPLDGRVGQAMRDDFLGAVLAQNTWDGKLSALPACVDSVALWGNKEDLERAGARMPGVEDPWTSEEFVDVLHKLSTQPGLKEALELHLETAATEFLSFAYHPLLEGLGGALLDMETMSSADAFNSTQSLDALSRFQSWYADGYADADLAGDSFARGESGLSWNGQWAWSEYDRALGGKLVLLPLPMLGESAVTGLGGWSWAMAAGSDNQDAAWTFMSYLLDATQVLQTSTVSGAVPARMSAAEHSVLYGASGPLHLFVAQLASNGAPGPVTPASPLLARVFAESLLSIARGADVPTELENAVAQIDRELLRLGYKPLPEAEPEPDAQ